MTATCIKDWPSHFVKIGDVCKYEPSSGWFVVKFPSMGWILVGERKFKRYFEI